MAKTIAVCRSGEKGTRKKAVAQGMLKEDYGLVGDGHADRCTHGQVSLLAMESVDKMSKLGLVRGRPITIHAHDWRITSDGRQGC